ncbi:MAG: protein translocase subunit SecF [Candidatus Nanoarchaeia archaeon]|nr:protein translocase subunit SecF [Candidatus Nanoarchaeia archaeon]MDD5741455.1 protein translocase subunit SecF [Candidatus Nanoarchaeia archaeon]
MIEQEQHKEQNSSTQKSWFDRYYKILFIIPIIVLLISLIYLGFFYSAHGDFILKDSSLSGGTTITLQAKNIPENFEFSLKSQFPDVSIRKLTDIATDNPTSYIIETLLKPEEVKPEIEKILNYKLTEENSNIEFTGPSLSQSFYKQLIIALVISFILMSIVIFVLFKSFIPSTAVIFAAFADIIMPLALIDFLGIRLSAAGIAAFLMLVGYSVDTDILLTSRALKRKAGTLNQRIFGAFKTGIFMTITALAAVLPAFFIVSGLPDSFRQIFFILALGLSADIINTWMTNAGIIKWYCDRKGIK